MMKYDKWYTIKPAQTYFSQKDIIGVDPNLHLSLFSSAPPGEASQRAPSYVATASRGSSATVPGKFEVSVSKFGGFHSDGGIQKW